jgi:hypothetical protein
MIPTAGTTTQPTAVNCTAHNNLNVFPRPSPRVPRPPRSEITKRSQLPPPLKSPADKAAVRQSGRRGHSRCAAQLRRAGSALRGAVVLGHSGAVAWPEAVLDPQARGRERHQPDQSRDGRPGGTGRPCTGD